MIVTECKIWMSQKSILYLYLVKRPTTPLTYTHTKEHSYCNTILASVQIYTVIVQHYEGF